jgi:hypothetical protein
MKSTKSEKIKQADLYCYQQSRFFKEELPATEFYQLGIEKYYTFLLQQVQEQERFWMIL